MKWLNKIYLQRVCSILLILWTSCSQQTCLPIRTSSSDVLYKGISNPFFISAHGIEKAKITVDNGTLMLGALKIDTLNYSVIPGQNPYTTITIYFNKENYKYVYRNNSVPDPVIGILADSSLGLGNKTSAKNFRTFKNLTLHLYDFYYNCSFKIIKYKMIRIPKIGEVESYEWNEDKFNYIPNVFTRLASQAEPGDLYLFSDCQIEFIETKEMRNLRDYVVTVH